MNTPIDVRSLYPETLSSIEEKFRNTYEWREGVVIDVKEEDSKHFNTKIYTAAQKYWDLNMLMFLGNKKTPLRVIRDEWGMHETPFKVTCIVKYSKTYNKVMIEIRSKELRSYETEQGLDYIPKKYIRKNNKVLTITEKGVFKPNKDNFMKLGYNTKHLFDSIVTDGKSLLFERHPHFKELYNDKTGTIFYLPSCFNKCKSIEEINQMMDPKGEISHMELNQKMMLYSRLKQKDYNELKKYIKRAHDSGENYSNSLYLSSVDEAIDTYYKSRYPSLRKKKNKWYSNLKLHQLFDHNHRSNKVSLPHYSELEDAIEKSINTRTKRILENDFKRVKLKVHRDVINLKRLTSKIIKTNFKFTHHPITTTQELLDACLESKAEFHGSWKSLSKSGLLFKVYYRGETYLTFINGVSGELLILHSTDKKYLYEFEAEFQNQIDNDIVDKLSKTYHDRKIKDSIGSVRFSVADELVCPF